MRTFNLFFVAIFLVVFTSCDSNTAADNTETAAAEQADTTHTHWSKNAVMYELNVRQFSEKGDFASVLPHLPRLKNDLGVDVIWLMPIHPIGEKNRKGEMGSYYSIRDYKGINPEFGTSEDFQLLVDSIHALGMKVIIDWVANHTAWDNPWATEHPEWYQTDSTGAIVSPYDWTDVIAVDYEVPALREAMIDALEYWVRDYNIDGYRCDVAYLVPTDFWETARTHLDSIKPVFMLAEAEKPELHNKAFDASYAWEYHHVTNHIASGESTISALDELMAKEDTNFSEEAYRLYFTTNHDENSWNGTVFERLGDAHLTFAALTFTYDGMPLLYNGQEAGLDHRLAFFTKDTISWENLSLQEDYKALINLKHRNSALWNGDFGGDFERLDVGNDSVYAFRRFTEEDEVLVFLNFYATAQEFSTVGKYTASYHSHDGNIEKTLMNAKIEDKLPPFGFLLLEKQTHE